MLQPPANSSECEECAECGDRIDLSLLSGFRSPVFVFSLHPDQLDNIQQVIQDIGSVPQLMLFPESQRNRQEEEFIQVRAGDGDEADSAGRELDPPSPKKSRSVQRASSRVSFKQAAASCSSSGQDQELPCITGW